MSNARIFTVRVSASVLTIAGTRHTVTRYEADFAGHHFSREHEADVVYWVRVAAKHVYGSQSQVIFLRTERPESP